MDLFTVDELLSTTRSVRLRLDFTRPVDLKIIEECLDLAVQAPVAGNLATYHFMIVTDATKRSLIADYYRRMFFDNYLPRRKQDTAQYEQSGPKFFDSATYLAEHFHEVPVHIIPCIEGRPEDRTSLLAQAAWYGSIMPTAWSLMLALRSRGLGAAWTTLHLGYEQEIGKLLDIPSTISQVALLPVAYYTGTTFKPAKRAPARERTYWNVWNEPHSITSTEPTDIAGSPTVSI